MDPEKSCGHRFAFQAAALTHTSGTEVNGVSPKQFQCGACASAAEEDQEEKQSRVEGKQNEDEQENERERNEDGKESEAEATQHEAGRAGHCQYQDLHQGKSWSNICFRTYLSKAGAHSA